jgi:uncharacterized protein (TIRG00374 family)
VSLTDVRSTGTGAGKFRLHRAGILLVVAALCATLAVPVLLGGKDALAGAWRFSGRGYFVLFALTATSWLARAVKLRLLLRRLDVPTGFVHVFAISLATDFAFMATPGGVGGYAASVYYLRRAGASTSGAATLTAADQLLDLSFFALALPLAGLALLGSGLPEMRTGFAIGATGLLLALALGALLARRKWAMGWLAATNALDARWPRLRRHRQVAHEFCADLRGHARVLIAGGPLFMSGVFALTMLQWLARYGVLWAALALLGHRLAFALTLSLQSLVLHAAQWSGVPSGGGGAELGLSATLAAWVPPTDLATALLLWRMATLYIGLAAGVLAIAWLARRHVSQLLPTPGIGALPVEECVN